jgi:hypothetical protein
MPVLLTLLLACGPQELQFATSVEGCKDITFDEGGDPTLEYSASEPVQVWLNGVWLPEDSVLDASVTTDGDIIEVSESWSEGTSEDVFCLAPTVTFEDAGSGRYEVFWFRDGASVAYDSVVFEVE